MATLFKRPVKQVWLKVTIWTSQSSLITLKNLFLLIKRAYIIYFPDPWYYSLFFLVSLLGDVLFVLKHWICWVNELLLQEAELRGQAEKTSLWWQAGMQHFSKSLSSREACTYSTARKQHLGFFKPLTVTWSSFLSACWKRLLLFYTFKLDYKTILLSRIEDLPGHFTSPYTRDKMIDLSFLTEEEQEAIMKVLQRDAELKRAEEERVR